MTFPKVVVTWLNCWETTSKSTTDNKYSDTSLNKPQLFIPTLMQKQRKHSKKAGFQAIDESASKNTSAVTRERRDSEALWSEPQPQQQVMSDTHIWLLSLAAKKTYSDMNQMSEYINMYLLARTVISCDGNISLGWMEMLLNLSRGDLFAQTYFSFVHWAEFEEGMAAEIHYGVML